MHELMEGGIIACTRRDAPGDKLSRVESCVMGAAEFFGLAGYANKQAAISQHMAVQCAIYWLPHLKGEGLTPS